MRPFVPDNVTQHLQQSMRALEQLRALGTVWIGSDMALGKKIVVKPFGVTMNIPLVINKKHLPDIEINRNSMGALSWSVRSFLAQSGIEIIFDRNTVTDEMIKDINAGKDVAVPVHMQNFGTRAMELEGEVMRFFWVNDMNRLRGEDLRSVLKIELTIDGVEGVDWSFADVDLDDDPKKEAVCIKLNLKSRKFYIPESDEPLKIKSRKELATVFQDVPEGMEIAFQIGETARVKLGENITGVINMGSTDDGGRHIRSPLIDPKFEGNIRTEIFDVTQNLDHIELFVYRKN